MSVDFGISYADVLVLNGVYKDLITPGGKSIQAVFDRYSTVFKIFTTMRSIGRRDCFRGFTSNAKAIIDESDYVCFIEAIEVGVEVICIRIEVIGMTPKLFEEKHVQNLINDIFAKVPEEV